MILLLVYFDTSPACVKHDDISLGASNQNTSRSFTSRLEIGNFEPIFYRRKTLSSQTSHYLQMM